jgi:hypothetical protein
MELFPGFPRAFWAEAVVIEMLVTVKTVSKTNVNLFIVALLHKEVCVVSAASRLWVFAHSTHPSVNPCGEK